MPDTLSAVRSVDYRAVIGPRSLGPVACRSCAIDPRLVRTSARHACQGCEQASNFDSGRRFKLTTLASCNVHAAHWVPLRRRTVWSGLDAGSAENLVNRRRLFTTHVKSFRCSGPFLPALSSGEREHRVEFRVLLRAPFVSGDQL
jgi:hypothetical protein